MLFCFTVTDWRYSTSGTPKIFIFMFGLVFVCLFVCFNRTPTFFDSIEVYLSCKVTTLYNNAIIRCSVELKQLTQIEKNVFLS